jgi:hypothetical protein
MLVFIRCACIGWGLLALGGPAPALAQQVTVTGRIIDARQEPLLGVTIQLFPVRDSTALVVGITDVKGDFQVVAATPGAYKLRVSFVGFRRQTRPLTLGPPTPQALPPSC